MQVGGYTGCAALIGVLFYWFNPSGVGDCSFNTAVIVVTIVICLAVTMAPLHPSVRVPGDIVPRFCAETLTACAINMTFT